VLVVSAAPDARRSSASLRRAVVRLARERELSVEWWFLRDAAGDADLMGAGVSVLVGAGVSVRVVDQLRTSSISSVLGRLGAHAVAARVAGLRLRIWWRRAAPDVVVLDDGLGGRVLPDRPPPVIVRVTPVAPDGPAADEPVWSGPVAGRWYAPGVAAAGADPAEMSAAEQLELAWSSPAPSDAAAAVRRAAGLPVDQPVVCWPAGDGDELDVMLGWLARGDARFDRPAQVVWVDPNLTTESHARVAAAARRAGVADRLHQRAALSPELARAADASVAGADAPAGIPGAAFDDVARLVAEVTPGADR
jgi:hypothetical protein